MGSAFARALGLVVLAACGIALVAAPSCRIYEPASKPIDLCRKSCVAKAKKQCTEDECEHGCEFILDRIAEREGETVLKCITSSPRRCTDVVWADCAAKIGVHLDGGPPGPAPPQTDEE